MSHHALSVSPAMEADRPTDSGLPFDRLPDPDYDRHPAYGQAFPEPSVALRLKAITRLAPWMLLVLVKRILLFDRLPSLPDYGGPMSGGVLGRFAQARRYVPLVVGALATVAKRAS